MERSDAPVLRVESLSVSYGRVSALRDVSLEVWQGELVALIGANGAGKSTLVSSVVGIVKPRSGHIFYKGKDIAGHPTERIVANGIALVPEGRGVVHGMTVLENLQLGGYHQRQDLKQNLVRVLEEFPLLKDRRSQLAGSLSGGELQTLAIGRALMGKPSLLIMDEPTLGLSPVAVADLFEVIGRLREQGQTILLSEQNATRALASADRAYVFEVGRVALRVRPRNSPVIHGYGRRTSVSRARHWS